MGDPGAGSRYRRWADSDARMSEGVSRFFGEGGRPHTGGRTWHVHRLLTLWDLSYAADAMDKHLGVLLDTRTLELGQRVTLQSLGAMLVLLEKKPVIEKGGRRAFSTADAAWILRELPQALRRIVEIRNPAAHGKQTSKDEVSARRAEIMGIGQEVAVVRMGRVGGISGGEG